jgi:hypothetical protein
MCSKSNPLVVFALDVIYHFKNISVLEFCAVLFIIFLLLGSKKNVEQRINMCFVVTFVFLCIDVITALIRIGKFMEQNQKQLKGQ